MILPSTHDIKNLSKGDVEVLTQLLALPPGQQPNEAWFDAQAQFITGLPWGLQNSKSLLSRILMALPTAGKACLCRTHKPLDSRLIRRIFLQVSAECTTRVARLSEYPNLPESVSQFSKRIQSINSLWMSPDLYRQAFQASPYDTRFEPVAGGCEACILAAVGGNRQILSDLHASMMGRKKKHEPLPRLLPLVESWVEWTGQADVIWEQSNALASEIRSTRRQLQQARRQVRRNNAEGIVNRDYEIQILYEERGSLDYLTVDDREEHKDEHDFEGSIINFYANIMSTSNLQEDSNLRESIHPAFRDSIVYDPVLGTFQRQGTEARTCTGVKRPSTMYSESVYSRTTEGDCLRQSNAIGYSEDYTRAYADLIGALNQHQAEVSAHGNQGSSQEQVTRMSHFF